MFDARRTQNFSENENENHADEQTGLLGSSSNTGITNNANGESCSKTSQTDRQSSAKLDETSVERQLLLKAIGDKD